MTADDPPALAALAAAAAAPAVGSGAGEPPTVLHVGRLVPRPLLEALGRHPRRLVPDPSAPTPRVDADLPDVTLSWSGLRLLEGVLAAPTDVPVVIGRDAAELPQLFAILRELARTGWALPPVALLDTVHRPTAASRDYVRRRVADLAGWLAEVVGARVDADALAAAIGLADRQRRALAALDAQRGRSAPTLAGTALDVARRAAWQLPAAAHVELVEAFAAEAEGTVAPTGPTRVLVCGSAPPTGALLGLLARSGGHVAAEVHPEATTWDRVGGDPGGDLDALADRLHADGPLPPDAVAAAVAERCRARGIERVVAHLVETDEAAPWALPALRRALHDVGVPLLEVRVGPDEDAVEGWADRIAGFIADGTPAPRRRPAASRAVTPAAAPAGGRRARKDLDLRGDVGDHQRRWFADLAARAADGEPIAVVDADFPQELLRTLDVPYVVNQWWASMVGAKQQTAAHLDALRRRGYPAGIQAYSTMALASALGPDVDAPPWGGLPPAAVIGTTTGGDASTGLTASWATEAGATALQVERTADCRWTDLPVSWWDDLPERWDEVLEDVRLDLLVAEIREIITALEHLTGRRFDHDRFVEVMALVNAQEAAYRRTRDLIARTRPAPVGIADTMPATMIPQWHRGTTWARDAALALEEAVAARARAGQAACVGERLRLAWVGRGLWSDMGFYQQLEDSHGAVFVWSMYLGLAADGYLRTLDGGRDPLRALAARFAPVGDELRMPTWAGAWHVREAVSHGCDGAVAIADADPFVLRALEAAGIPVLRLPIDNTDRTRDAGVDVDGLLADFCDRLLSGG